MLKKRQKNLLSDFLGVGGGDSERKQITKDRDAKLFEQRHNLFFQL